MVNGAKVALAVGAGYFLGRTRKMRLALMLAAAGVTGKFPTTPTALAAQGLKSLGASADVSQLSQQLRGEVLNAAKAAALAAAMKQVDSLNDRLQGVSSAVDTDQVLEDVGDTVGSVGKTAGGVGKTAGGVGESLGRLGRRRSAEQDEDVYDEYQGDDEEPLDVDEDVDYEDRELDDADLDEDEDAGARDEEDIDEDVEARDDEDIDEDVEARDEEDIDEAEPADEIEGRVRSTRRATRQSAGPKTPGRRPRRAVSDDEPPPARTRRARGTAAKAAPVRRGR